MANTLIEARRELALANRIVAHEGVIDAFGHVSMRHPDNPNRYLLSRSRAPELVEPEDFIEYDLDSQPARDPGVGQYSERVIHGVNAAPSPGTARVEWPSTLNVPANIASMSAT